MSIRKQRSARSGHYHRREDRLWLGGVNREVSRKLLPREKTANMLRWKLGYHILQEPDGSKGRAACHQRCSSPQQRRSPGDTCHWWSAKRLRVLKVQGIPSVGLCAVSVDPPA